MTPGHRGKLNGYIVIYTGRKTVTGTEAYYYEHDRIAEDTLGRKLRRDEVVHHLDLDRANNHPSNLLVTTSGGHARLHHWINAGCYLAYPPTRTFAMKPRVVQYCPCGTAITRGKYCSPICTHFAQRRAERPTADQLQREIATHTWTALGKKYGVTDNAVKKWARGYGIETSSKGKT